MKVTINPDVILNEKDITKDIEKFARICAETIIEEAQTRLVKFAQQEMEGYYGEYTPWRYKRTNKMKKSSYQPFSSMSIQGDAYEGGILIHSDFTNHKKGYRLVEDEEGEEGISKVPYTEEEIYENVWIKGTHGYENLGYNKIFDNDKNRYVYESKWRLVQGKADRLNRIKRKAYSDRFKNRLLRIGLNKAQSQSYSILKFS